MKKILIMLILSATLLTACGQGNNKPNDKIDNNETLPVNTTQEKTTNEDKTNTEDLKASDYLSFEKDVYMKFKGTGNEYAEYETYVDHVKDDVVQVRNINPGTTTVSIYKYSDGELKKVFYQGETYFNFDFTDYRKDEEVLIKEPIKVGTSWEYIYGGTRSITAVDKEITTPAGVYKALEVTTEDSDYFIRDYYVKGIGLVKSEFVSKEDDDYKVTSELEKLEKDATNKQSINFYFPDFNNDRIVFEKREFDIKTNQDILNLLEVEMKKAPKDKGAEIDSALSANANILGIGFDIEKGILTVDFSPELLSEMNAGTSYEAMIIQSIVNTLGDYFLMDKVIITVEGKPYSSGHIYMKDGEFFSVIKDKAVKL